MSTRTYNSPLRAEQMAQTRERILEKVSEILATPGIELTVAEAASRAQVSIRTAYRYFPTKEALVDAFNEWSSSQMGLVTLPKRLDEVVEYAATLGRVFAANETVLRATQRTTAADEVRRRRKQGQARTVQRLVDEAAPAVDPVIRKRAAASLLGCLGFDTWTQLRDLWGLEPEECIATMQWNATAILAQLERAAPRRR